MSNRITRAQAQQIEELLLFSEQTYEDLAAATGMAKDRIAYFMRSAKKKGQLYVSSYAPDKNGRLFTRRFMWGAGEDAPRPGRVLTSAEQMRKLRASRRKEVQSCS